MSQWAQRDGSQRRLCIEPSSHRGNSQRFLIGDLKLDVHVPEYTRLRKNEPCCRLLLSGTTLGYDVLLRSDHEVVVVMLVRCLRMLLPTRRSVAVRKFPVQQIVAPALQFLMQNPPTQLVSLCHIRVKKKGSRCFT